MPLDYRQVRDLYDKLSGAGATSISLPEWSRQMNDLTGSDLYSAGQHDNVIKRTSVGIDKLLEASGVPQETRRIGGIYGGLLGDRAAGEHVGESLPRTTVNMLPYLIPGAGAPAAVARLGGAALLSGADAYTKTDSPAAGLIAGGTAAVMPKGTDLAEQYILKKMGARLVEGPVVSSLARGAGGEISQLSTEALKRYFPETFGQSVASNLGGQVAGAGISELGTDTEALGSGQPLHDPFTVENFINLTLGQAPFAAIHLGGKVFRTPQKAAADKAQDAVDQANQLISLKSAQDRLAERSDIEKVPTVTQEEVAPEILAETQARLAKLREQQMDILTKGEITPDDAAKLAELHSEDDATPQIDSTTSALGVEQPADSTKLELFGTERREHGKSRTIQVSDDPRNPEEFRGKTVNYSKGNFETPPMAENGVTKFAVPRDWHTILPDQVITPKNATEALQPTLPEQSNPALDPFDHVSALDRVESDVDAARSPAQLQKSVGDLNRIRETLGLPSVDDSQLQRVIKKILEKQQGGTPIKAAIKSEAAKTKRLVEAQQRQADVNSAQNWYAEQATAQPEDQPSWLPDYNQYVASLAKKGSRSAQLVASGQIHQILRDNVGAENVMNAVKIQADHIISTGAGLLKIRPASEEIKAAIKGNEDAEPAKNLVLESALQSLQNKSARAAYDQWGGAKDSPWEHEKEIFADWVDEFGPPEKGDIPDAAEYFADRYNSPEEKGDVSKIAEWKDELGNFLDRPHVKIWLDSLNDVLSAKRANAPGPTSPRIPAGGGFVWGLGDYDALSNRLNSKHTLPKSSELKPEQFVAMAGRGKPLPKVEFELLKTLVPEAFDARGNVNVRKLYELLPQREPQIEVKKLGEEVDDSSSERIIHELETAGYEVTGDRTEGYEAINDQGSLPDESRDPRIRQLWNELGTQVGDEARGSRYSFLGPKSEQDMPGYVEGLVRIPSGSQPAKPGEQSSFKPELFSGPHFGSEDTNVLAFYRGYEETLPDGKKAFHVIEVQSDWGQAVRKAKEDATKDDPNEDASDRAQRIIDAGKDQPLLSSYETLALKAAIQHAREIGADSIILSDGETAMMTEGHDKAHYGPAILPTENNVTLAKQILAEGKPNSGASAIRSNWEVLTPALKEVIAGYSGGNLVTSLINELSSLGFEIGQARPNQEQGMRLHYDTTLPSALAKLTGERGERVEVGRHSKSEQLGSQPYTAVRESDGTYTLIDKVTNQDIEKGLTREEASTKTEAGIKYGSPVFRNPDGSPKSSISGRIFSLSRAFANLDEQQGFTLGDPARALQEPQIWKPQSEADMQVALELTGNGHTIVDRLSKSGDPEISELAKNLKQNFPEALNRILSSVYDAPGSGAWLKKDHQVQLVFDPSVVSAWKGSQDNILMHELLHGLTLHELRNPKVDQQVVQDLTDLRLKLIDRLPTNLKSAYEKAQSSDWYKRYSRGEAGFEELHPDALMRQVLYGLLNNDELVSQAFTSRTMRNWMQSIQSQRKKSTWNAFTSWAKKLLKMDGMESKGTAFEDFMGLTSQLMNQGEYLSSFSNFGERYFEGLGKGGAYGKAQTQRALGLAADAINGTSKDMLATMLDFGTSRNKANTELNKARQDYQALLASPDGTHVKQLLAEVGHKDLDQLSTEAIVENKNLKDVVDLLPDAAQKYLFEKLQDSKDVLDVLAAATNAKNKVIVNIARPEFLRSPVSETLSSLKRILALRESGAKNAENLARLAAVDPSGFLDALPAMAPKDAEDFINEPKGTGAKALSAIAKFLEPMGQLARRVPESAELLSKAFQLSSNSRKMFSDIMKVMGMDISHPEIDTFTHDSVKQTSDTLSNPKLANAVHKWMYWNNKKGGDSVQMLPDTDVDVAKALKGLSDKEKADVVDVIRKQGMSTQTAHKKTLEMMQQIAAANGASVIQGDTGYKAKDNLALSHELLTAVMNSKDPMMQPQVTAQIMNVQQRMQPEAFLNLLKFTQSNVETLNNWKEYFDANPFWATAQRTERYLIKAFKNGKPVTLQASSIKEAKEIVASKGLSLREPPIDQWNGKDDEPFQVPNMTPEMTRRMQELEQNQMEMLSKIMSPEQLMEVQKSSAVRQIIREANATQNLPGVATPPRLLGQGAEELPWLWNHITWAQRQSNYWSRQLLRAQSRLHLNSPEIAANPDLQSKLGTHIESLLRPDPPLAQKMTRLAATWFLGYNLATSIVNASQPFTTHVAELTAISGKPLDSYRRVLNALNEIGGRFVGKKDWASPEHEQLMNDAVHDGEIGIGKYDDEAAAQEAVAENYKRAMMKNKPQDLGQRAGNLADKYSELGMYVFQHGERVNSRAAVLAAFDLYRDQGLSYTDAKAKAYEFNRATNYSGGRAQRPVGAYSGQGAFPRTLAMMGTSLQSYVLGTTGQLARYLQQGFASPRGVTPAQSFAARRAFVQMLGTQLAAAGILGLPGVSSALSLLDKFFPNLESNRKLRETVNQFLSDDKENGSSLTDIAMTGVPSMLGWDLQSRLSMGNTVPGVSEVNGFQPENLLGPTSNIVSNFTKGVQGVASGQPGAAMRFLPPAVAKTIEAANSYLNDNGNIRDYAGRPLANPTRGEQLGTLLGFQPTRLSAQNSASRILKNSEDVVSREQGQFHQQMGQQILDGNFGTVRQALLSRAQQDQNYDPVAGARKIAEVAEELSLPRDLRSEGSLRGSDKRAGLLSSFAGADQQSVGEQTRLQMRLQILQRLGVPPGDLKGQMVMAQVMDSLRASHPEMTRMQLRQAAAELLHGQRNRSLLPTEDL